MMPRSQGTINNNEDYINIWMYFNTLVLYVAVLLNILVLSRFDMKSNVVFKT